MIVDSLMKRTVVHYTIKGYDKQPSAVMKAKDNSKIPNLRSMLP